MAVVCVTLARTPVPEKKIRSNIWCGLSPGIYGRDDINIMISLSDVLSGTILLAVSLQQECTSVRGIGDERALSSSSYSELATEYVGSPYKPWPSAMQRESLI